ncbi:MAG: ATP-binding cassette domain-containing protein, partial [Gammaproteobacteria bacterium]|nr:ATP-binding cassette domain-containing protein [Gammaproteobacteria bacterium]
MSDKLISVKDLSVDFVSADYEINAVNNISFDITAGETLAIVGESGSGKSVTAMSLMRLHEEKAVRYKGSIHFQQQDVLQLASSEMQSLRGGDIAMIFQEPMTSLNPVFTVGDQVSETLIL